MPAQERTNEHANEHENFATTLARPRNQKSAFAGDGANSWTPRNQRSAFAGDGANFWTNFAATTTSLAITDIKRRLVSSWRQQAPSTDFSILHELSNSAS